ncbi:MAG: hypothetical protein MRY78_00945 [Saprospiraceae bacterium]|nr:hypothetical protein [Saprospiraceae bacterium]
MQEEYQDNLESHLQIESENASTFVRMRNQLHFRLFNRMAAEKIHLGKNDYMHSAEYCETYIGKDYAGDDFLRELTEKLEHIYMILRKQNKHLIIELPPGKARVYPQTLPDYYEKGVTQRTSWDAFRKLLASKDIPVLDFSELIVETHPHPVYPQLGLHWNYYGSAIAAQRRMSLMEKLAKDTFTQIIIDTVIYDAELESEDRELLNGANLLSFEPIQQMPYPVIRYEVPEGGRKPNVLVVGDSFYKIQYKQGLQQGAFSEKSSFWYYNNSILPQGGNAHQQDLAKVIGQSDFIIFSQAEINIHKTGFGIIEPLLQALETQ